MKKPIFHVSVPFHHGSYIPIVRVLSRRIRHVDELNRNKYDYKKDNIFVMSFDLMWDRKLFPAGNAV